MTRNVKKIPEYRRFFERHAQKIHVEIPTEERDTLSTWLVDCKAVLADESNVFDPQGNLVSEQYVGPARNICRLHVWVLDNNGVVKRETYIREVSGMFHGSLLKPDDPTVFDWDSAFTPFGNATLHDMDQEGIKNSAREQCLSAFVEFFLRKKKAKQLKWTAVTPTSIIDWDADVTILLENPLYRGLPAMLDNSFNYVVNQGIFFRSGLSRRDANYWWPGLNGGIPYVPKKDKFHEATYMFHDLMHQLLPDLIFDGGHSSSHKNAYIIYRMMSEAISLVYADMCYVSYLAQQYDYDFSQRKIYPLYSFMRHGCSFEDILKHVVEFVVLGKEEGFPVHTNEWLLFKEKYSRFFVGDFQWTRKNWANLLGRSAAFQRWIQLIGKSTLRDQGLMLVSDMVDVIGDTVSDPHVMTRAIFEYVKIDRLSRAAEYQEEPSLILSRSCGFRRWLTGQCFIFARYEKVVGIPDIAKAFSLRLRDDLHYTDSEMEDIRTEFRKYIDWMADLGIISEDDRFIYPDLVPLFDPFFLRDYDRAEQEFKTVREASSAALVYV